MGNPRLDGSIVSTGITSAGQKAIVDGFLTGLGIPLLGWQREAIHLALAGNRDGLYRLANRRADYPERVDQVARNHYGERHPATGLIVCFLPVAGWVPAFDRIPIMNGLVKL